MLPESDPLPECWGHKDEGILTLEEVIVSWGITEVSQELQSPGQVPARRSAALFPECFGGEGAQSSDWTVAALLADLEACPPWT